MIPTPGGSLLRRPGGDETPPRARPRGGHELPRPGRRSVAPLPSTAARTNPSWPPEAPPRAAR
eukprot:6257293-Lingulodinium_polyedra.AAC.1